MMSSHAEWKLLVKSSLAYSDSNCDVTVPADFVAVNLVGYTCLQCDGGVRSFPTQKALASHMRSAHNVKNMYRLYVDGSGKCPVCSTNLHSRLRVIAHLSDPRRNLKCRQAIHDGTVQSLPQSEVTKLDALDTLARREAQRAGRSHPIASESACKADGRKCGRPATH